MRKTIVLILFLVLAVILVPWLHPVLADQVSQNQAVKSVVFKIGVPYYVVNGQTPGVKMDVSPFIQNDRTFVPVRFLGNALGVSDENITWDDSSQTATIKGNSTLQMTLGSYWMNINGDIHGKGMDVMPVLMSSPTWRTFLPARYIAERLGYQVAWDDKNQTVICWAEGHPQSDFSGAINWAVNWLNGQKTEAVNGMSTLNGYQIPVGTNLDIRSNDCRPNNLGQVEMEFVIWLNKGDLQSQYNDTEAILSQSLDMQTVNEMIAYIKQKTDKSVILKPKCWNSANGKSSRVSSDLDTIGITVWSTPRAASWFTNN
ncbi:MAG: hypothetical protein A4E53_00390 [Pelotomaculum sp. PtaB.Bin104]|nr:MAG: hypothetical protein A4E53_00390 [Pelotomaculum sp. PtaB.Bin104]